MHSPTPKLIPPEVLLLAYRSGIFPMADSREEEEVFWVEPRQRAILPLDHFLCSRSLAKVLKQDRFRVTVDADFARVVEACAQPRVEPDGSEIGTWISHAIAASYRNLHRHGHAHSVECWLDEHLVGGLYGAVLLTMLKSVIGSMTEHHLIVIGLIFIGAILFLPRGLIGLFKPRVEEMLRSREMRRAPQAGGETAPGQRP